MDSCDALIVGGGPAGSSCARALVRHGLDVLLLDKSDFPRDKVCAGWVTPEVVEALELDLAEYAAGRVLQPITGFRTGVLGGRLLENRYAEVVSYGIRRCELDHYLLQRAGARLKLGEGVQSIERSNAGWLINGRYRAPLLIGAGGHFCPVARWLGASLGSAETVVAAKEVEFLLTPEQRTQCPLDPETPELFFCRDLKGYGWCLRKGDYLNIGLGREDNRGLSERLDAFCGYLRQQGRIPAELPDRFHGHAYLLYPHSSRPLFDQGALLIGDAAGLAYLESGEGIRPAVESGLLAADAIVLVSGDYRAERLALYAERLAARFGPRRPAAPPSPFPLLGKLRRFAGRRLLANRWLTRRLVLDRWFLRRQQAALELGQI